MKNIVRLIVFLSCGLAATASEDALETARRAREAGRLAEAEAVYRGRIAEHPHEVRAYLGLAEVLAERGAPEEAAELLLRVARGLGEADRWHEAVAPLERAAELTPSDAEAHALLGRAHADERRFATAVASLERAVALDGSRLLPRLHLAAALWETRRLQEAEDAYRGALELPGDGFLPLFQLAQLLFFEGRSGEAVPLLERAARLRPKAAEVHLFHARALTETGATEAAAAAWRRTLALDPERAEARRGLDQLLARQGLAAAAKPAAKAAPRQPASATGPLRFRDVAAEVGIDFRHDPGTTPERHLPETMGAGLAWLDADGDGWWDLYLVQSGPFPPAGTAAATNRLYRNRGPAADGRVTFEDVTAAAGAGDRGYGQGAVAADVDGDGDTDLYLTNFGPDVLLTNRGGELGRIRFEDTTLRAGLGASGWSASAAFADADADGDLDLYVARYVDFDPAHGRFCGDRRSGRRDYCSVLLFAGVGDRFYLGRGDGTFAEATVEAGLAAHAERGLGVLFTDLDGDGTSDLYVANDLDPNRLYRGRRGTGGRPRFEDVSLLSGTAFNREGKAEAGMGVAAGDVDGDGLPELAVTNFDVETNSLYRNLGGLLFEDASASSGFGLPSYNLLGFGVVLADFDGDGDLDAYVADGHVFEHPRRENMHRAQGDLLLLGDGRGGFTEAPAGVAGLPPRVGRGLAACDFDNDGDLDLAVQNNGGAPLLLENRRPPSGRWLGVVPRGRAPNTAAVGARLTLTTAHGRQVRQVTAGGSYLSSGDRRVLFAWPAADRARELAVRWPSGETTRIADPPAGRYLEVDEPRSSGPDPSRR